MWYRGERRAKASRNGCCRPELEAPNEPLTGLGVAVRFLRAIKAWYFRLPFTDDGAGKERRGLLRPARRAETNVRVVLDDEGEAAVRTEDQHSTGLYVRGRIG